MAERDPDADIYDSINALSREEEELWASAGNGRGLDPDERDRLDAIKVELDRLYDLIHQRQALRAAGRVPGLRARTPIRGRGALSAIRVGPQGHISARSDRCAPERTPGYATMTTTRSWLPVGGRRRRGANDEARREDDVGDLGA